MLISVYITPVMFTDSTGYMAEAAAVGGLISIGPVGWVILGVAVVSVGVLFATGVIDIPKLPELPSLGNVRKKVKEYRRDLTIILSTLVITNVSKMNQFDNHHIVAQNDPRAGISRMFLRMSNIGVNDPENLVYVRKPMHWVMHTNEYHAAVTIALGAAYSIDGERGVRNTLATIKSIIAGVSGGLG